ncbi:longevity assurance proteins LAG1/LAC1 [Macrolepiota fuliginosa MF-IS2]|uniref:Longevity assurance proteins LAG1/LAC1 n=1 Tax=Macrolepiota fuliginosa MF-IS2 TaxID=1400762 RepID=A0A9P5XCU8_9AGAR|nr:longevity assurance proteins LAG1/LAC1 [Macrolepiota fuliginosa MF-IS2]
MPHPSPSPLGSNTPERAPSPVTPRGGHHPRPSPYLRWAVQPSSAFKLLAVPLVLYANWYILAPLLSSDIPNPFAPVFLLAGHVSTSSKDDPRYAKSWWDLVFIAYYIVFWSFVRQSLSVRVFKPLARYFGLKKPAKVERFCEQGYALVYFAAFGAWGYHVMTQLPTYWYRTDTFWIDYPHWDMKPELKRYYLMQSAYWCQQLIVLVLGLEKPRKDYHELVAHHAVTLWLVGWSYLVNLTFIGNAVFMSMDIPDMFLAASKILNYIQWDTAKMYAFVLFIGVWTYFRHYLNLVILWSVWHEYDLIPESSRRWVWSEGVYMLPWMKYQVFAPLLLLQLLNVFWYYLMMRILWSRAIVTRTADDDRSDDEDDGNDDKTN